MAAEFIIWDECIMHDKNVFRCANDILVDLFDQVDQPPAFFAGKTILLCGDFRQILPVVTRGGQGTKMRVCINNCEFWQVVETLHLTKNERVNQRILSLSDEKEKIAARNFASFLLQMGEGRLPNLTIANATVTRRYSTNTR
jgi:ATP-dependent DNA helicase PIF1